LVRDNAATIDLRSKPTRDSLGFRPGSTLAAADRDVGSDGIRVHVVMPTGKAVDLLAYGVASEARRGLDPKGDRTNPAPTQTIVNTRYATPEAAQDALLQQADALGLSPDDVGRSAGGARPGVLANGVIQGLRQDWLLVEVEIRTQETPSEVQVNYQFEYNAQDLPTPTPTPSPS
jgi:hypothetical protein